MSNYHKKVKTFSILVKGKVQGIGFRPFIYRIANKLKLKGFVRNTKAGVLIKAQGENWQKLVEILRRSPPELANIAQISIKKHLDKPFPNFTILKSISDDAISTIEIPADLAVCKDCIRDIFSVKNRRYLYPFTNCTQCGPRYSIIYNIPYDRQNTTMRCFEMCPACSAEYNNPLDRRFHAQPNACSVCGPQLLLYNVNQPSKPLLPLSSKKVNYPKYSIEIIKTVQELLANGKILAIKSIGGFLLACDAKNTRVVEKLRKRKNRPVKPFALMCKDIKTVKRLCYLNNEEIRILKSKIAPIVLLKKRPDADRILSNKIAPQNGYLGIMLPYTPLHHLLFYPVRANASNVSRETSQNKKNLLKYDTLIMTSGNLASEPIISDAKVINQKLKGVVDFVLDNNREIESRCDDSIVFNFNGSVIIRRSRGYVPEPILLKDFKLKPVLAFGADLKSHFALAGGNKVYYSPYIGDLSSKASIDFMMEMIEKYQKWFNIHPEIVACDLHPDYISTRMAEEYAKKHKIPLVRIQHHFAHLAGVMAENNLTNTVLGIGFDGTGYGMDGNIWGGEIMALNYRGFKRITYLEYMPLIGGDIVITNPKLLAKTYLNPPKQYKGLMTSSIGRLFDAVAAIVDVCSYQTFEGEAPIALENEALKTTNHILVPKFNVFKNDGEVFLRPSQILNHILTLKQNGVSIPELALHFHDIVISATVSAIKQIIEQYKIYAVCLSGGVFQNRIILNGIYTELKKLKCNVFINRRVPINDGGIALGQAVIASFHKI
ncbi:MAG: carbamoyltransferase HypF [candidate division WOR-3 bacterium]